MRNYLNGFAEIFAAAFLVEDVPVDFSRCEIGILVEVFVYKAFVVTEIKVGFRAVLGDKYFAVLIRAHRAGVNVYVRVKLLSRNLESSCLEQTSERRCRDSFSQTGNNSACDKYILCRNNSLFLKRKLLLSLNLMLFAK